MMNAEANIDQIKKTTLFLIANKIFETAPHHLSPAIELADSGRNLHIIAPADPPGAFEENSLLKTYLPMDNVHWVKRGVGLSSRLSWHFRVLLKSVRILRRKRPDEIYVYGSQACAAALILHLFSTSKVKKIYHTQDYLEPSRHPFRAYLEGMICRRSDLVIVNERNRGRILHSAYRLKTPPLVVTTGLRSDWPVPARNEEIRDMLLAKTNSLAAGDEVLVIHQGPLRKVRCGRELVGAMQLLPANYRLVVTGMSPEEMNALVPDPSYEISSRFLLLPASDYQMMLSITASCDIGVLLYPNDGIGNFYQAPGRLSENCRCSIPSIASNFPPFEAIACRADILELCDPYNPKEIATAILRLGAQGKTEREKRGREAKAFALAELTFDKNMSCALRENVSE